MSLEKRLSSMVELLKKTICIKFTSLIWMQLVSPSKIFLSLVQTSCWVLIVYSQRNKNICIYILDMFLFNYASVYNNIYPFFLVFGKEEYILWYLLMWYLLRNSLLQILTGVSSHEIWQSYSEGGVQVISRNQNIIDSLSSPFWPCEET